MRTLRLMGVHGLGDHRSSTWKQDWERTIRRSFPGDDEIKLEFDFISYDDIFENTDLSIWQTAAAVAKLAGSGLASSVSSLFSSKKRGLFDSINHTLRWYAGYVVAWVENEEFQARTRKRVYEKLLEFRPDVLLAHSLGSLVTYNALTTLDSDSHDQIMNVTKRMTYVTLGSQIGNPFIVRNLANGRLAPVDSVRHWFHLYNSEDAVFTSPIRLWDATNFTQVDTYFDIDGMADHDANEYLSHRNTSIAVWTPLLNDDAPRTRAFKMPPRGFKAGRKPRRKALLIGINDYPDPEARLSGCVNDVFEMSSLLQECSYRPEDVRICLDDRATAQGIRSRLQWLLEDPMPGDELVFYFSGHGAQLPAYGDDGEVDRMEETLVPHDFDWSPERCITDDQIFSLYSQLPYDTRLVLIFDCCHSGGMHRAGAPRAKGLNPPDDIRHRALQWNAGLGMWEERKLTPMEAGFADKQSRQAYAGEDGCTLRLGRAMPLRRLSRKKYDDLKKATNAPVGPYLPLILEACAEHEYAYEYRHGQISYGAFTYTMGKALRDKEWHPTKGEPPKFHELLENVKSRLKALKFDQTPQILGPESVVTAKVPWTGAAKAAVARARRKVDGGA